MYLELFLSHVKETKNTEKRHLCFENIQWNWSFLETFFTDTFSVKQKMFHHYTLLIHDNEKQKIYITLKQPLRDKLINPPPFPSKLRQME